jgi:2-hydroxychromene-2-carboxylate isomerase
VHLPGGDVDRAAVAACAASTGQPGVRWPEPFPFDSRLAMLAATFAKQTGRGVAFSLAAMRQAFLAGRGLEEMDNVLIAAAACELHPRAVLNGVESRGVAEALEAAAAHARDLGVTAVPSIVSAGQTWTGTEAIRAAGSA